MVAACLLGGAACAPIRSSQGPSPESDASPSSAASPSTEPSPSGPLAIGTLPFHDGEVGLIYPPLTLGATGGLPPYTWSISAGRFPPGLTLSADGTAGGKNSAAGKFGFTVKVVDSAGTTATKPAAVTVYSAVAVTQKCATKCVIGGGCTVCGAFGTAAGGKGPYTYRIAGGGVPRGMTWNALSLTGGFPVGSYSLAIAVSDQLGATATVRANWSIYAPAVLKGGPGCVNSANPPSCTTAWSYSGGNPSVAPKVVITAYLQYTDPFTGQTFLPSGPPPNWTVTVKSGVITMSAGGVPCGGSRYAGYLRLAMVDTTACATTSKSNLVDLLVDISNNC